VPARGPDRIGEGERGNFRSHDLAKRLEERRERRLPYTLEHGEVARPERP
jgi:hypothetical protein